MYLRLPAAVTLALLASACHPLGTPASRPALPPRLVFAEVGHEGGQVTAGSALSHHYAFRNTGGLDLTIDNLRAACDCTATVESRTIKPGAASVVDARCETTNASGHVAHTITVYSNDPAQPVTTLTLSADVDAEVVAEPPRLYVGHCHRGQMAPGEAQLVVGPPATVTAVETAGAVIDAALADGPQPAAKRVRVMIKKDAPSGRFEASLVVRTTSRRRAELRIPVIGVVDDDPLS